MAGILEPDEALTICTAEDFIRAEIKLYRASSALQSCSNNVCGCSRLGGCELAGCVGYRCLWARDGYILLALTGLPEVE